MSHGGFKKEKIADAGWPREENREGNREEERKKMARKRSAPFVIKNACVVCRKKRARCDGNQPCARCVANEEPKCHYDVSTRISKEAMREEIEILKAYKDASDRVLGALARDEAADGESSVSSKILDAIRSGESLDEISRCLEESRESMSGSRELKREEKEGVKSSVLQSPTTISTRGNSSLTVSPKTFSRAVSLEAKLANPSSTCRPPTAFDVTQWTTVTSDLSLIENLMAFYFCWEYPIFASISKSEFLSDYFTGRPRYCSSLLVNSILSVGHRYLAASADSPDLLAHNDSGIEIGSKFQAEAERLLEAEKGNKSLTTVQALGMLSIREASCGRNSESWGYSCASIRMAVEMGLHRPSGKDTNEKEADVRVATFWGAFALDQFWSLNIGRMPHISRDSITVEKPHIVPSEERENWGAYNNVMSPLRESQQPANIRSVCQAFAGLTETIHDSQHLLYEPRDGALSQKMLAVYRQYLDWYANLPAVLRLGVNSTPSVLFAHIYYHFSLILFFRPFLKLRFPNSHIVPRDICLEASSAISLLVKSYRQMHTLRRTPCLFSYMVFAASVIHLICVADTPVTESDMKGMGEEANIVTHIGEAMDVEVDTSTSPKNTTKTNTSSSTNAATTGEGKEKRLVISEQVIQDIRDLNDMSATHAFARRARQILVRMAMNWNIAPPADLFLPSSSVTSPSLTNASIVVDGSNPTSPVAEDQNVINWQRVMEREGVFETQPEDEMREGLRRSTSFNFFCPDLDEELPRQFDDSHSPSSSSTSAATWAQNTPRESSTTDTNTKIEGDTDIAMIDVDASTSRRGEDVDGEVEPQLTAGLRGGATSGGFRGDGQDDEWAASDGKPFFSPFLAQKLPLVSMNMEGRGRKFTF